MRHGQSKSNQNRLGQHPEIELSPEGIKQAQAVADRVSKIKIDYILASTMRRASQTAQIINEVIHKPIEYTDLLRERKRATSFIGKSYDDPEFIQKQNHIYDNYHDPAFRFEDEETFSELKSRGLQALKYIENLSKENLLVVTHGTFARTLFGLILFEGDLTSHNFLHFLIHVRTNNTGITYCEFTPEDGWQMISWNDHAHLG